MSIRPLLHPKIEDVTVAGILHALADPVRVAIVTELLHAREGLSCVETLSKSKLLMPKSTCSQHYQVLREAGLVRCERKGVELTSRLRLDELESRFPGLISTVLTAYEREQSPLRAKKKPAPWKKK